jgi:DNA processing protein
MSQAPSPQFIAACLHFLLHPGLTPADKLQLAITVSTPQEALQATPPPGCNPQPATWAAWLQPYGRIRVALEHTLDWLDRDSDHHLLSFWDAAYPAGLRQLQRPPLLLFLHGNHALLEQRSIAMVGSRNATQAGRRRAREFSAALAARGWGIVSGMAKGIDSAAHWGAIDANGATIASLGCGIDITYPPENTHLKACLLEAGGLLVSEYPPLTPPQPIFFPLRNRIIAGLCKGLVVVEATPKSGSLITAEEANVLGKPVMALPGSIDSPQSKGCHHMIRSGAVLVEAIDHIELELATPVQSSRKRQQPSATGTIAPAGQQNLFQIPVTVPDALHKTGLPDKPGLTPPGTEAAQLLGHFSGEALHVDHLSNICDLPPGTLASLLQELELSGHLEARPGQWWMPC